MTGERRWRILKLGSVEAIVGPETRAASGTGETVSVVEATSPDELDEESLTATLYRHSADEIAESLAEMGHFEAAEALRQGSSTGGE